MGKTWSDLFKKLCAASSSSSPLSKLSLLPAEAYSPPAQPRPNLNAVPHIALHCTVKPTCIASKPRHLGSTPYCTVLRPQTAPRHNLKATTSPTSDRLSLPSTAPPHHSVTKMYIFQYIRIFFDSNSQSVLFISNFGRNNIHCFEFTVSTFYKET